MRYKLLIAYDGTSFCGWQRQKDGISVQQVLEDALKICLREEITLFGSGRTDAGVHAIGQVAHFDATTEIKPLKLRESLNALVRPYPICIKSVEITTNTFHARFDAKKRTYIYRIFNAPYPPVLLKNKVWWIRHSLDMDKMQQAANLLIGKHDFSTFRASECQAKSPVKTIDDISFYKDKEEIIMQIQARSFLHHQVRNIIGTLSLIGMKKWDIADFESAFKACDRTKGGPTAPPDGLYFMDVEY